MTSSPTTTEAQLFVLAPARLLTVNAERTTTIDASLILGVVTATVEVTETPLMNQVDTTNGYVVDTLTIQNTQGVTEVQNESAANLRAQLDALVQDSAIAAVKIVSLACRDFACTAPITVDRSVVSGGA